MLKFVYKILPAFVTYSDKGLAPDIGGRAKAFYIRIRPRYKDDIGILEHELQHVRQAYKGLLLIHILRYRYSAKYKFKCEVEAYALQNTFYSDNRLSLFAQFIATKYNLPYSFTYSVALAALRRQALLIA